jgi:uncharacterized membrane protein
MTDRVTGAVAEERTLPAIVYGLYLLGVAVGVTSIVGLMLALANRSRASARIRTHYTFQIRSCWLWLVWMVIGIGLIVVGAPLSLVLIGIPLFTLGWVILGLGEVWFSVRAVLGVVYLLRGEAYPRPYSWFF